MSSPLHRLDADICAAPGVSRLGLVDVCQARLDGLAPGHDVEASLGSHRPRTFCWPPP